MRLEQCRKRRLPVKNSLFAAKLFEVGEAVFDVGHFHFGFLRVRIIFEAYE